MKLPFIGAIFVTLHTLCAFGGNDGQTVQVVNDDQNKKPNLYMEIPIFKELTG